MKDDKKKEEVSGKPDKIEELKKELEECQKLKEDYLKGWQRERADFINYKKEERERVEGLIKYANEELILKLLPILDTLYLAEREAPEELKRGEWFNGFLQIKKQLEKFLEGEGVEEIEVKDKNFNPEFQEAVEFVEKEGFESGTIVEVLSKGYKLRDKIIRPVKVKVAK
jgi:molecular chaperone GrpE